MKQEYLDKLNDDAQEAYHRLVAAASDYTAMLMVIEAYSENEGSDPREWDMSADECVPPRVRQCFHDVADLLKEKVGKFQSELESSILLEDIEANKSVRFENTAHGGKMSVSQSLQMLFRYRIVCVWDDDSEDEIIENASKKFLMGIISGNGWKRIENHINEAVQKPKLDDDFDDGGDDGPEAAPAASHSPIEEEEVDPPAPASTEPEYPEQEEKSTHSLNDLDVGMHIVFRNGSEIIIVEKYGDSSWKTLHREHERADFLFDDLDTGDFKTLEEKVGVREVKGYDKEMIDKVVWENHPSYLLNAYIFTMNGGRLQITEHELPGGGEDAVQTYGVAVMSRDRQITRRQHMASDDILFLVQEMGGFSHNSWST